MWSIKNFEKCFWAHQYMPKIIYDPHKNPLSLPPAYLLYGPLLGALGASLLENLLTSKSTITAGEGTIRASRSF